MERGYVRVWRRIADSGLLQHPRALQLFMHLLLTATSKPCRRIVAGAPLDLKPGEVVTGRERLAQELGATVREIRTAMDILKKMEIVTSRATNKYSVVFITNWDRYQYERPAERPAKQPAERPAKQPEERPANGQQATTEQEYKNIKSTSYSMSETAVSDSSGSCPHQRILDVYRETLPSLSQPRTWRANDQTALRTRWNEKRKEGKFSTVDEGVEYFRKFFRYVGKSSFLMGRVTSRDGRTFQADIRWLLKASNFDKVLEGKYHES